MLFTTPDRLLEAHEEFFGRTIEELMAAFPDEALQRMVGNARTKWKVEPGALRTGRFAYAILRFDKGTGETLAFGAIENDVAPEHEHVDGETILTLAGVGFDVTDQGERVALDRGSIIVHAAKSIHAPGSRSFWAYIYFQPKGMKLINPSA